MDPLGANPFSILTFIVAPAILTNASSIISQGTSNRLARTIDRARTLSVQLEGREEDASPDVTLRFRLLSYLKRRVLLLVRALTAFYLSIGAFAAASLISLLGAVFVVAGQELLREFTLWLALCAGMAGVGGLVTGSGILIWETQLALRGLAEETAFMLAGNRRQVPANLQSAGKQERP
ncbi:MAG: DUF2721 domain-containing protein [Pirellulaceae bacterium]